MAKEICPPQSLGVGERHCQKFSGERKKTANLCYHIQDYLTLVHDNFGDSIEDSLFVAFLHLQYTILLLQFDKAPADLHQS